MEEASKAKKAKKGFMTPERKKKLRVSFDRKKHKNEKSSLLIEHRSLLYLQLLLRKKAAEELKKEQERKAAERRRIIEERCGSPRNLSDASEGMFTQIHFHRVSFSLSIPLSISKLLDCLSLSPDLSKQNFF